MKAKLFVKDRLLRTKANIWHRVNEFKKKAIQLVRQ